MTIRWSSLGYNTYQGSVVSSRVSGSKDWMLRVSSRTSQSIRWWWVGKPIASDSAGKGGIVVQCLGLEVSELEVHLLNILVLQPTDKKSPYIPGDAAME